MATNQSHHSVCLFLHELDVPDNIAIKSTAYVTSVLGFLVATGAIIGNSVILFVLAKFERLQIPSNLLLGSLCVADLTTGVIVQPLSITRRMNEAYNNHICTVRLVCAYFAFLCVVASIINVCMISIDRYLAITMPFWYQRRICNAKYVLIISILWVLIAVFALLPFTKALTAKSFFNITFILMGLAIAMFLFAYSRIAVIVRTHRRKIRPSRHETITVDSTTGETFYMNKERKKAYTIAIIVSFALISYLPLAVMFILRGIIGDKIYLVCIADTWADFILHFNSLVNPMVYCFRSEEIRQAVIRVTPEKIKNFVTFVLNKASNKD